MITDPYRAIPYLDGGRNPARGLDCWGLTLYELARDHGITGLPDLGGVMPADGIAKQISYQRLSVSFVRVTDPCPGDLVCVFNIHGEFVHLGVIFAGDTGPTVRHTTAKRGVETLPYRRFVSAFVRTELRRYQPA